MEQNAIVWVLAGLGFITIAGPDLHGEEDRQRQATLPDEVAPWTGESAREAVERRRAEIPDMVEHFRERDIRRNDGRGYSDASDSTVLAWRQSRAMQRYIQAYRITGDAYWLARLIDHFDRMLENRRADEALGRLGWTSARGVSVVETTPLRAGQDVIANPPVLRLAALSDEGRRISGEDYRIVFVAGNVLRIENLATENAVEELAFDGRLELERFGGLLIEGEGREEDGFTIRTKAAAQIQLLLHDAMIVYPIAMFIESVLRSSSEEMQREFGDTARRYLQFIESEIFEKWEPYWTVFPDGTGTYRATDHPSERFPGYPLNHNRYLIAGRVWMILKDLEETRHAALMEERARLMGRYFRQYLRSGDGVWAWNFWDAPPGHGYEAEVVRLEDMSHGAMTASFVYKAWKRGGAGFGAEDIEALANTFVRVMWNGSLTRPRFLPHVVQPPMYHLRPPHLLEFRAGEEWHRLAFFDSRVWRLLDAAYEERPTPEMGIDLAYVTAWVAGELRDAPAAPVREWKAMEEPQ